MTAGTTTPSTTREQLVSHPVLLKGLTVLTVLITASAAAYSGMNHTDRTKMVLPIIAVVAIVLGLLAATRFGAFVLLLLGARASIDIFKLSGSSAGNTSTNTAAARGLDPSSILAVLFLLAAMVWLAARLLERGELRLSWLSVTMVTFGTAGFISALSSARPLPTSLEGLRISAVVMMYLVLEQLIEDDRWLKRVLIAAFASLAFPLLYTLFGFVMGGPASEVKGSFTRITGPFSQSTTFGRYLDFMIIMGVAIIPFLPRAWKWVLGIMMTLSGVFLALTLTRGALLGALVGLVVVMIVLRSKWMAVGFLAMGFASLAFVPGLAARMMELTAGATTSTGAPSGNTLLWRLRYWADVLPLWWHSPVTGIGLNMTQYNLEAAKQPHNDFIRAIVETGAVGFAAYLGWITALLRQGWLAIKATPRDTLEGGVAAGFLGCAVAFVGESLGANIMSNVVSVWYLVAFAAAAGYVTRTGRLSGSPAPAGVTAREGEG